MNGLSLRTWGVALGCVLISGRALAQDISELEGVLNEAIVSSASKHSEGASAAPALATSLTAEDLRKYGVRTLGEAIDFLSLAVSTSDNLAGGEVGARGVLLTGDRGSHFLLLVDGYVVNDPLRGSSTLGVGAGIPLELIDHIEIVVGPGSVLYGSNAMLGIMNVVTKRAKDYSGVRVIAESALPISVRVGAGAGTTFKLLGQEGELTTQLEYYKQDGPALFFESENTGVDRFTGQPGRNRRDGRPTGIWGGARAYDSMYADSPSGLLRVVLGSTELHVRGTRYQHASPTGPGDFDDKDTRDSETRLELGLSHRKTVSTLLDITARGYANYFRTRSDFIASRGVLCPFGQVTCDYVSEGNANWIGLELQSTWDWFRDGRFVTILGTDARRSAVNASSATVDVDTREPLYPSAGVLERASGIIAGYLQQTWTATESLKLNGGARVDADPRFSPVVTPRVAVIWDPWKGGTIKLAYSSAFRAPSWDETDSATARRIKAVDLQPEHVKSVDLTVQQQLGRHRAILGGFYSRWDNLVELAPLTEAEAIRAIRNGDTLVPFTPGIQLTQYRNTSEVQNYGLNTAIEGGLAAGRISYGISVTAAIAEKRDEGGTARLPVAPRLFGNARVAAVPFQDGPTVALATQLLGPRSADLASGFAPTPFAPTQLQLRLTISGDVPKVSGLSYRLLANYRVADRGAYVVGPVTSGTTSQSTPQLVPLDRFRTTVGVQYAF
jgi:outer membrane receptor for ferrienterochelin and colicins